MRRASRASKKDLEDYKKKRWTVEFPDGHKEKYDFRELEEKYNDLKDQRTKLNAKLGEVIKPVTAAGTAMTTYVADHMVDLTPAQIEVWRGRQKSGTRRSCRSTWRMPTLSTAASPATWAFASR